MAFGWGPEQGAELVLRQHLDAKLLRGAPAGEPLLFALPDSTTVAVAVARHRASDSAARAENRRHSWHIPHLGYDWVLGMGPDFDVREVHRIAPGCLTALEEAGVDVARLDGEVERGPLFETRETLRRLGVRVLYRAGEAPAHGGELLLGDAPGPADLADLAGVVAEHAAAAEITRMLAGTDATERHVFVWVEGTQDRVVAAMAVGTLPDDAPALPPKVDAAWLCTAYRPPRVWRFHLHEGWLALD